MTKRKRLKAWITWIAMVEGVILLLALAGPGHKHSTIGRDNDHRMLAEWVMDDPGYLDAVAVNFVAVHIVIIAAWLAAIIVTRLKKRRETR